MEVYLLRNHGAHDAGNIYDYDDNDANKVIAEGLGVKVDFPTVQNYEREINKLVENYREERRELETTERYRDNLAEREFQLSKLKLELDAAVQEKKDAYAVSLEVLYRENAAKAFDIKIDDSAKSFVDAVRTQFNIDANKDDLVDMLIARLKSATPEEKAALSLSLKDIPIPAGKLAQVEKELRGAAPGADAMLNCTILQKYKQTRNPIAAYEQLKVIRHGR
jgi:hypothetical protein